MLKASPPYHLHERVGCSLATRWLLMTIAMPIRVYFFNEYPTYMRNMLTVRHKTYNLHSTHRLILSSLEQQPMDHTLFLIHPPRNGTIFPTN